VADCTPELRPDGQGLGFVSVRDFGPDARLARLKPVPEFRPRFVAIWGPVAACRAVENLTNCLRIPDKAAIADEGAISPARRQLLETDTESTTIAQVQPRPAKKKAPTLSRRGSRLSAAIDELH
jgi:hypothetical protein